MNTTRPIVAVLFVLAGGLALQAAQAQQPSLQRTDLLQHDLGVPGREVVQVRVDFEPGASSIKYSHPGEEIAYVLEGSLEYQLEGGQPVMLKAGEGFVHPSRCGTRGENVGSGKASELATYVVEKGTPLFVPVN